MPIPHAALVGFVVDLDRRASAHVRGVAQLAVCAIALAGGLAAAQSAAMPYVVPISVTIGTVGTAGSAGDNGNASAALLGTPVSLAYDAAGNLYILDKGKNAVRKVSAATNVITTVAGTEGAAGAFAGDGGPATSAKLNAPNEIALDAAGNIYIADTTNNRIRKVTVATGIITTIAGDGSTAFAGDGLAANGSQGAVGVSGPNGVAVDTAGNVYLADSGHQRVRVVSAATGIISTILGGAGTGGDNGNGGPALTATIDGPRYLTLDSQGQLLMTDRTENNVRYIATNGNVYALAGTTAMGYIGDGGPAAQALMNVPNGTASDAAGNVYIMDTGNTAVRVVDAQSGNIYTLPLALTGTGASTPLSGPLAFAVSPNGTFVIADSTNHVIRSGSLPNNFATTGVGAASPSATFTLTDGNAVDTISSWGLNHATPADFTLGTVTGCTFGTPLALYGACSAPVAFTPTAPGLRTSQLLATDAQGNRSYLALTGIGTAAAAALSPGTISTIAGTNVAGTTGDGAAATASTMTGPAAVALDAADNVYLTGADNTVRMVNAITGTITRVAGTGAAGYTGDGAAATAATLKNPSGVALDPTGNVFIADTGNNAVRLVGAEAGVIRSVTPPGLLNAPKGVATDLLGNLYIADTGNNLVREVAAKTGVISTLAGTGSSGYAGDNGAATSAQLNAPAGIAVDASGSVYIADTGNNVVRKITSAGVISTIAGTGTVGNSGDGGSATMAQLNGPSQLAVDAAGDVYVACAGSQSVRLITAAGLIATVAGTGTSGYSGNGVPANTAALTSPNGVAVDQFANIYVGDTGNNVVRKVAQTTSLSFAATDPGKTTTPQLVTMTNFGNQPLTLTGVSIPSGFIQKTTGGLDCTSSTTLPAGGQCLLSLAFSPTGSGPFSGNVTLTDNALGNTASTQKIAVSGTGNVTSLPTTIAASAGNNQTAAPYSAFATTLQATVLDQNGFGSSGVSVVFTAPANGATGSFSNGTNSITVVTGSGGVASTVLTAGGTRGAFAITAKATGIAAAATFNETIAGNPAPTITVSISPSTSPVVYGSAVTLTATLTGPANSPNAVTGTVTLFDGTTQVGSATIANGIASVASVVPSAGIHSYSVTYGGDANYMAATSTNTVSLTVTPLAITASANAISVPYGTATASVPAITGAALKGVLAKDSANVTPVFTDPYLQTTGVGFSLFGITLQGSAASNYTVTTTSGITVTPAPTTLMLTSSLTSAGPATTVTLTSTLTSAVTGTALSGATISFYDGATLLGVRTASATGVATYSGTLALGRHIITAVYAASTNYATVTSSSVTIVVQNPDVPITLGLSSITVKQGQVAVVPIAFNTLGGLATTVTFACSGLPANATCTFTPATFTPVLTGTVVTGGSGIVSITTAGAGITASVQPERPTIVFAGLFGCLLVTLTLRRRKLASLLVLLLMVSGMSGCGSSTNTLSTLKTPVGTSTVTVTASSGTVSESSTFTLIVTPAAQP